MNYSYTLLILLLPILIFLFTGLAGNNMRPSIAGLLGTSGLFVITLLSYFTAYQYFGHRIDGSFQSIEAFSFVWLPFTESLIIKLGILLDPLSVMMLVVITTVSFMVHIYSLGYMKGEVGFERFFAFLSLFSFTAAATSRSSSAATETCSSVPLPLSSATSA